MNEIMATEYTAVKKTARRWADRAVPVNCQERTRQRLIETLRTTLPEAIEFNRQDVISFAGTEHTEEKIAVPA